MYLREVMCLSVLDYTTAVRDTETLKGDFGARMGFYFSERVSSPRSESTSHTEAGLSIILIDRHFRGLSGDS